MRPGAPAVACGRQAVLHRTVIDPESLRLLLAVLTLLVYGMLAYRAGVSARHAVVAVAGVIPFALWAIGAVMPAAARLLDAGTVSLPSGVERLGVLLGAAAVGLEYGSLRTARRRAERTLALVAAPVLVAAVGALTTNWLVTVAIALTAAAVARPTAAVSGNAAPGPQDDPPDTR